MKKYLRFFLAIIILPLLLSCSSNKKDTVSFTAMNTFVTIQAYGKNSSKATRQAQDAIIQIENRISTTNPESFIFKLNHSDSKTIQTDKDTLNLIQFSLDFAKTCDSALNISLFPIIRTWGFTTGNYKIPDNATILELLACTNLSNVKVDSENCTVTLGEKMEIDLGAVGKGYAGDKILQILKENHIESAIIDLGGNIQTLGAKPDGNPWSVGIKSPFTKKACLGLKVINKAVVTSGGYERFFTDESGNEYIHIFDSKTGYPVNNEIAGVTIICEQGLYADALSTTMFALGTEKAFDYWRNKQDFEMLIITKQNELFYTKGIESYLSVIDEFKTIQKIQ